MRVFLLPDVERASLTPSCRQTSAEAFRPRPGAARTRFALGELRLSLTHAFPALFVPRAAASGVSSTVQRMHLAASASDGFFAVFSACRTSRFPTRCSCCRTRTSPLSRSTSSHRSPVASPTRRPHASATENSALSRCPLATLRKAFACSTESDVLARAFGFGTFTKAAALIETS